MPEWVQVWFWMRFRRDPQVMTALPQQDWRDPNTMSVDEFENYRIEWHAAGAPTVSEGQIVAAMLGEQVPDEEYVPF